MLLSQSVSRWLNYGRSNNAPQLSDNAKLQWLIGDTIGEIGEIENLFLGAMFQQVMQQNELGQLVS